MINENCKANNSYRENNISIDNNDKLKKALGIGLEQTQNNKDLEYGSYNDETRMKNYNNENSKSKHI